MRALRNPGLYKVLIKCLKIYLSAYKVALDNFYLLYKEVYYLV